MKKTYLLICGMLILAILTSCTYFEKGNLNKAGMLIEGSIEDSTWDKQGLDSLQHIEETYDVKILYQDEVDEKQKIINAIDEFVENGVNLIFGHSNYFGKYFVDFAHLYPDVHFVYFNGNHFAENVTSIHFNSHALGFFAGMVAGKMTKTNHIGAISAYEWQTEVEGFFEGAKYENPLIQVHIEYVNNWEDQKTALSVYEKMNKKQVDVMYPAGDFFSESIINQAAEDGLYVIGFLEDQAYIGGDRVLTSTVRDIEHAYTIVADQFNQDELEGGILTFDVEDQLVSLGTFSQDVPQPYQRMLTEEVDTYKETGLLPYQR